MSSSPILQAWAKMVGPSPSMCSLKRRPRPALASILRSVALRTSRGTRGGPWSDQGRTFARIERILEEEEDRTDFVRRAGERELKRREAKKGSQRSRS